MRDSDHLDELIDRALRGERMLSVPAGFAGRVERRLQFVAAIEAEKRRFRYCFIAAAAIIFVAVTGLTALAMMGEVVSNVAYAIPGALGYTDYAISLIAVYWPAVVVTFVAAVAGTAVLLLMREVLPRLKLAREQ